MTAPEQADEVERLRQEHNAAVANGLVVKARHIARAMDALERSGDER